MQKKYFLLFILIFSLSTKMFSQTINDTMMYIGLLKIDSIEQNDIPYKLKFYITDSSTIIGYSVTDIRGNSETVSKITGSYNKDSNSMHFQEIKINKSKIKYNNDSSVCLIQGDLKFVKNKATKALVGDWAAYNKVTKLECISGYMELINGEKMNDKLEKIAKKLEKFQKKRDLKKELKKTNATPQ